MKIDFVEPWIAVSEYTEKFVKELHREVGEHHVLWARMVDPIAQRIDSDDVLFEVKDEPPYYAVVHLTWRGIRETDSRWPDTTLFSNLEEWIRDRMLSDHREFIGG
jgi:hypothetical protein